MEKSPSIVLYPGSMQRAVRMFPMARFIHLVEHPRQHCEAVVAAINDVVGDHPEPRAAMASPARVFLRGACGRIVAGHPELDPQQAWFALNKNICEFLEALSETQKLRVRAEDVLRNPDEALAAIRKMACNPTRRRSNRRHETSRAVAYTLRLGPKERVMVDDGYSPARCSSLPGLPVTMYDLDSPFSWREDSEGFSAETKDLARQFGYTSDMA